jgi:DNA polymerase V
VKTVFDLIKVDPGTLRRKFSVMLERTVLELRGTACIDLDHSPQPRKQIACTRSFGHSVTELYPLNEAVTDFASRAAQKARKQGSQAAQVLVFIHTSPFRKGPQYSRSITVPLRRPSADTAVLVTAALAGLKTIYRLGFVYAKAGVMLLDLQPLTQQQGELDLEDDRCEDRTKLMGALDSLNQRFGRGTVLMASAGLAGDRRQWSMKQERRTPGYTTRWADIPLVRA